MIPGLSNQEFWGGIIAFCAVGLIYFGRQILDEERAAERVEPFKWGDAQRRARDEPLWASHPLLAAFTMLAVLFVLQMAL